MGFQIPHFMFHKSSLSERFFEEKAVNLLDELTDTKLFLRKFLSSFYLRIFTFSPSTSMGLQISLCKFHKNILSERLL